MRLLVLLGLCLPFFIWFVAADLLELVSSSLVPTLFDTSAFLLEAVNSGEIESQTMATGYRWLSGFLLGVVFGAPIGVFSGQFKLLSDVSKGPVEYLRSIPVTALIPLFLALLGVGDLSRIAMVGLPTFLLMIISLQSAVRHVSPARAEMARSFNAKPLQVFWYVLLPEVLPAFFTGVKLAVSLSLVVVIVSEMFVGTRNGIGQRIYESYMTSHMEALFGYLVFLGVLGLLLNLATERIERWALIRGGCSA